MVGRLQEQQVAGGNAQKMIEAKTVAVNRIYEDDTNQQSSSHIGRQRYSSAETLTPRAGRSTQLGSYSESTDNSMLRYFHGSASVNSLTSLSAHARDMSAAVADDDGVRPLCNHDWAEAQLAQTSTQASRPLAVPISSSATSSNPNFYPDFGTALHLMLMNYKRHHQHNHPGGHPNASGYLSAGISDIYTTLGQYAALSHTYMGSNSKSNIEGISPTNVNKSLHGIPLINQIQKANAQYCLDEPSSVLPPAWPTPGERPTEAVRFQERVAETNKDGITNGIAGAICDESRRSNCATNTFRPLSPQVGAVNRGKASGGVLTGDSSSLAGTNFARDFCDQTTSPDSDKGSELRMKIENKQQEDEERPDSARIQVSDIRETDQRSLNESKSEGTGARTSSSSSSCNNSRIRTAYNSMQILNLEREFCNNMYLSRIRRIELSQKLKLSEKQVKIWFQNRRVKYKKESQQKMQQELR